ncbi:coniferyl aldehyde dehydrogenase [Ketogulonicigenium vulgare]|uniref:Aldehyde dehydrogenase n=1 Tax=Ketogulonicigenium vulgare (strain WSH-001) TaxID=759362 RepID=F9Y8R7_KETVW|nr:coniferyl aldehyde dehydrogenase [Ketogulonicigenium vulgare]ADO43060.1 aldehyde dehydrogenase [Ketogulonicigenium vulgare Y25]AEM41236.1 Aldehyde Dehydrogenase [Ketogulonicigenium vulgare WSH-001]ALJ81378.1 aldehyde dehydrogenase [Ketogulonicigenium vulgare]ANW34107.1 aldehyde dehydrogenase [Ketogulonicigenium vulgare]AOZ54971.1 aldehyde dehydrogenase [Ketogulonicigenium vulgare]
MTHSDAAISSPFDDILAAQRAAFLQEGPPALAARKADLKGLRAAILAHRDQIERAVNADFGHRSRHETAMMEIMTVVQGIDYLSRNLRRFMRPERRHVALTFRFASARVEYQPLGVIGIVSPWNYPVGLALMPLATAIAAGNRAMIKPSELTPQTSALIATMLGKLFPPDQVAVVAGDAEVGAAFTALPFDHLLFTGSTRVGKAVMRAAAENLVPVTLELGGKSPVIIAPGHADDATASGIAFGKYANAGQTCVAPDYVLVHADEVEPFRAAFDRAVSTLYPQGIASPDYTSIINKRHFARLNGLIEDAAAKGARIVPLGRQAEPRAHALAPTLILDPTDEMEVMQEEIFGPVLPVVTYRDLDEAIAYVNARPRPLALYYFGADDSDRRKVLARTTSGNVGINNTLMHYGQEDLPFGGVGPSGMGAYHGIEGFRTMSHAKGIYAQGRWNAASLLRAPFGRFADRVFGFILR